MENVIHWTCTNYGCPERAPVPAAEPPTCYTCGVAMQPVVTYDSAQRPIRPWVALTDSPANPECRWTPMREPTAEQRTTRTLGPIAIEISGPYGSGHAVVRAK